MKVLVSGSLRDLDDALREQLRGAARELGQCLAVAGHTLLVGSEDPEDVDPFVVEGFLSTEKASAVEVHLMRGAKACYSGVDTVKCIWHRYDDWDVTVLEVVRGTADGVIVVGGRKGVIQAGIAGWMLGRPIIPLAGFGGGAATVWGYGSSDRRRFYFDALSDAEIDQLNGPWAADTAETVVEHLGRCAEYARRATVPLKLRLGVSIGILGTLILWVLLLALPLLGWPPAPAVPPTGTPPPLDITGGLRLLLLLGSVCSAGAFGALVQTMRGVREGRATTAQGVSTDAVLGIAAGFLTAALYMLAQIAITGKLEPPTSNADYSRVSLIVSMASVFASLYLDTAFSRFDEVKASVMSGHFGEKAGE
jgi:hypothetical protein